MAPRNHDFLSFGEIIQFLLYLFFFLFAYFSPLLNCFNSYIHFKESLKRTRVFCLSSSIFKDFYVKVTQMIDNMLEMEENQP